MGLADKELDGQRDDDIHDGYLPLRPPLDPSSYSHPRADDREDRRLTRNIDSAWRDPSQRSLWTEGPLLDAMVFEDNITTDCFVASVKRMLVQHERFPLRCNGEVTFYSWVIMCGCVVSHECKRR